MTGNDAGSIVGRTNAVAPHGAPRVDTVAPPATSQHERDTRTSAPLPVLDEAPTAFSEEAIMTTARDSRDTLSQQPRDSRRARDTDATDRGGKVVAWAGFIFGSVLSIVMNWLHTWLPAASKPHGWTPGVWPQIGSAVWPVTLLLAVEALSRVRWKPGLAWSLARYGGVGTVAAGSALISYGHVHDVLQSWEYGTVGSAVGPLVLDGLMVACGFALLSESSSPTTGGDAEPTPPVVVDVPAHTAPGGVPAGAVGEPSAASVNAVSPHDGPGASAGGFLGSESIARYQDATPRQLAPTGATPGDSAATARDSDDPNTRDERILVLHAEGRSTRGIADEIGVHHSTVARIVARYGSSDTTRDTLSGLRLIQTRANGEETAS
ncbi:helix-turn-helix domain-containing protein [Nocardia sp. NPDC101769]|uniref:helix-turn-helix domain-containing protein n=1 Tax=Nocardia sp. NPDC101769 TaxID=3364333 RepID=UPI003811A055